MPVRPEDLQLSPVEFARPKSYWREVWVLLHWPRAFFIYCFFVIGALLSPHLNLWFLGWTFLAVFCGVQLCAYRLDQLKGHHVGATIPDSHHKVVAVVGFVGGLLIYLYLVASTTPWAVLWLPVALLGIVGYNFEVGGKAVHNMVIFGFTWGAAPVLSSYHLHAGTWPSAAALFAAALAQVFAALHLWSYGQTRCKHADVCDDHRRDRGETMCHGQLCQMRLRMPRAVSRLSWTLITLQNLVVGFIVAGLAAFKYLG